MMKNKILYKNFLQDNRTYILARNWWKRKFRAEVITNKSDVHIEKEFIYNWHNDKFRDGNPIFTVASPSHQKLVRVIQEAFEHNTSDNILEITAWIDKKFYLTTEMPELVISLQLSRKSSEMAFKWIKKWFEDTLKDEELEKGFNERNFLHG